MKGIHLTKSTCEKDLGVILSLDLKPEKYIRLVVRKASNTFWLLTQSLRYLDIHSKISAYTSYVRPQLEYATVIWSSYLKKGTDRIERVQKRFVKGLKGFRNLPHDKALRRLTLNKLETRRAVLDLKTLFKIVHGNFGNVKDKLVQITTQSNTISHGLNRSLWRWRLQDLILTIIRSYPGSSGSRTNYHSQSKRWIYWKPSPTA